MNRFTTLSTALLLAGLAAAPALASDASLQSDLNRGGFDVDVSTLSNVQKAQINAAIHSSDSANDKRSFIYSTVN